MILVKANEQIMVMDNIKAVNRIGKDIEFCTDNGNCYPMTYNTEGEAQAAFNQLFEDLAKTPGVDGAILTGTFV